jgi:hypothetical protein
MPEIAQNEYGAQSHEDHSDERARMALQALQDRDSGSRRQARKSTPPAWIIAWKEEREMFEEPEKSANLPTLAAGKCREVAIHIMRKARVDARHGQADTAGKEDLGRRLDKNRFAPMKHTESDRRRSVIGDKAPVQHD